MNKLSKYLNKLKRGKISTADTMSIEEKRSFIINNDTPFQVREAYKALRTNLIFSLPEEGSNKIIVSSSLASEGKSTTCINLAIAFAEIDKKVIVVDCDLRRPNIANLFDLPQKPGLTNVLVRMNDLKSVIKRNVRPNVDVLTAGDIPPNPSELLSSSKMKELIDNLSSEYDYVFIDTPPILAVTDTTILTKYCTGVLLLAHCNQTDRSAVAEAVEQLHLVNAKILGGIFNGIASDAEGYKYNRKYKYGKYGKYSGYNYGYSYGYS
ncbi:MAG: CpsD/CapB family tyrosine-protein kinase, partial [Clostridia bacterium]